MVADIFRERHVRGFELQKKSEGKPITAYASPYPIYQPA
jgi:hypothetical protein